MPAGLTRITTESGDRAIYVSTAGSDSADGLSAAHPIRSLERGYALLRSGTGDQLLLKRGDTWRGPLPTWNKSGNSSTRPMLLGAYGTGNRPTIATTGYSGFATGWGEVSHLAIQGLRITASSRDPDSSDFNAASANTIGMGLSIASTGGDLLIEDCEVSDFASNIAIQGGRQSNVRLRHNLILEAYAPWSSHSQGLFVDGVHGLLLENNLIDHNGWSEKVSAGRATVFNHNAYLTSSVDNVTVRGNIFSNAASHGLQARSGGDILDNLFIANPLHMSYGLVRGDGSPRAGGVKGIVNGNVFLGTRDIDGQTRGVGVQIANIRPNGPTLLSNNIFSNVAGNGVAWQQGGFAAIRLEVGDGVGDSQLAVGINDLTIQGNIVHRWARGLTFENALKPGASGTTGYRRLVVKRNEFSDIASAVIDHPATVDASAETWTGNHYDGGPGLGGSGRSTPAQPLDPSYTEPNRSLKTYMQLRGADASAFIAGARSAPTDATYGAAAVINYVRAGFENPSATAAPRNWNPPTPPTATADLPLSVTTEETGFTFKVAYTDDNALDLTTIDSDDVVVMRGGRALPATLVAVDSANPQTATATYHVNSPAAVWRYSDRGQFKVKVVEGQVKDTDGFSVEPEAIATATIDVIKLPPPPSVKQTKFYRGKKEAPDRFTVKFNGDLATIPAAASLVVMKTEPSVIDPLATVETPADLSTAVVTYDVEKRLLTYTLATPSPLAASTYTLRLGAASLQFVDGKPLDGNADGLAGDDYFRPKPISIKR